MRLVRQRAEGVHQMMGPLIQGDGLSMSMLIMRQVVGDDPRGSAGADWAKPSHNSSVGIHPIGRDVAGRRGVVVGSSGGGPVHLRWAVPSLMTLWPVERFCMMHAGEARVVVMSVLVHLLHQAGVCPQLQSFWGSPGVMLEVLDGDVPCCCHFWTVKREDPVCRPHRACSCSVAASSLVSLHFQS